MLTWRLLSLANADSFPPKPGPYYAVEIDVLFHGPALAAEREEIFDGLGGTQGRGLDELDVGAHVSRGALVRLQLVETVEDEIGKRHQRGLGHC